MIASCITGSAQGKKRKRQDSAIEDIKDLTATDKNGSDLVGERIVSNAAGRLKMKTASEDKEEMNLEATRNHSDAPGASLSLSLIGPSIYGFIEIDL